MCVIPFIYVPRTSKKRSRISDYSGLFIHLLPLLPLSPMLTFLAHINNSSTFSCAQYSPSLTDTNMAHSHDGVLHSHSHGEGPVNASEHGHSHEILDGPGSYTLREMPLSEDRDWDDRAFTIGIGG